MVPIENQSGKSLTLKKGNICSEINILNESKINVDHMTSYIPELKLNEITTGHLNNNEKSKLESILIDYDKSVNTTPVKRRLHCAIFSTITPYFMCWNYFDEYFMDKNLLHISLTKFNNLK